MAVRPAGGEEEVTKVLAPFLLFLSVLAPYDGYEDCVLALEGTELILIEGQ